MNDLIIDANDERLKGRKGPPYFPYSSDQAIEFLNSLRLALAAKEEANKQYRLQLEATVQYRERARNAEADLQFEKELHRQSRSFFDEWKDEVAKAKAAKENAEAALCRARETFQQRSLSPGTISNGVQLDDIAEILNSIPTCSHEAELCRARVALSFYAEDKNWNNDVVDIGVGEQGIPDSSECMKDAGQIANSALSSSSPCRHAAIAERVEDTEGILSEMRKAWAATGSGTIDAAIIRMVAAVQKFLREG